ncbi:urease accessory protein UreD [Cellulomonas dongxiuzhuiae]|uniref:Urease accessory protein UreD n=1 Tax=Cellulomonas dongxiuzhuiae TaxID=2819979 RepID=A0ABX8GM84_9CELL|nr:urease accessory protein UreD [Cellulomonas dongxiuzhuiae]MBO3096302.1 urease accessory protein UreD [Cellulomonas dongxiuzhuiae]QWC16721.1 urease accessory protein UreD [Cellulomonas dongxiuzhuiae]
MDVLQVMTEEHAPGTTGTTCTRVALTADGDLEVAGEALEACRLPDERGRVRVALVSAGCAERNGRIEVEVAPGRGLEIVEVTGTGTHDVRRTRTQWLLDVRLGRDAVLVWPSLPIVVADGADVLRLTHVDLATGARVVLRETLVLGGAGAAGGRIRSTIRARLDDRPLLAETFVAEPAPLLVGAPAERRLETLLVLGARLDHPEAMQLEREGTMLRGPAARVHDGDLAALVPAAGRATGALVRPAS